MADTIRKLILENIKTTLESIKSIRKVALHEFGIIDLETYPMPAAFIYPDSDDEVEEESRWEVWTMPVVIEIYGRNIEVEKFIGDIHKEMLTDETRGGYAERTDRLGGTDIIIVDPARSLGGLSMRFEITYRHKAGDPYSQSPA